ncbi:hypothetical protein Pla108_34460 [Botrimarina colliarenosi]|uniref:Hint domain-containing protein n=1 Tax=Botrimarina colliarenosi TaxID=2528001 RepID=A0A5C6A8E9_9BACT|nr:polymorphic toxin-type HINT domain-containing protein [Botrimarina colliarenosi]TWT95301.1 hypothetical protein Pla108_34460 [Botrimarina colliarenosi]
MRRLVRVLCVSCLPALLLANAALGASTGGDLTADQWHAKAIEATLAGDSEARQAALNAAVKADPDHEPSRGERGEVFTDGQWVTAHYAQYLAADNPDRQEYEERRAALTDTPAAHARLAKWCDRVGLSEEARPHWLAVLHADPDNAAALSALDSVWRGGRLVDGVVAREADNRVAFARRAEKAWESRLRRLERGRGGVEDAALAAFRAEVDEHAALPVERRIAAMGVRNDVSSRRQRAIAESYIEASIDLPSPSITASLCRIATNAADKKIASLATEALESREKFDVMPLLLKNLRAPIESEYQVSSLSTGGIAYEHRLYAEGSEVDQEVNRQHLVRLSMDGVRQLPSIDQQVDVLLNARIDLLRSQQAFAAEAQSVESQVAAYNKAAEATNGRVIETLQQVTGENLGDQPRRWWDYWQRYSGYDVPYERPVAQTYDRTESAVTPLPPPPAPRCECFVAGTPVWTRDGKQAIETLQPGDLVMARDPHRGSLVYRTVIDTTVREPSPMVEVVAGDQTIQTTVGHPFWVVGRGWRMAKQLAEGDVLSTVNGPATVTGVNDYPSSEAFNLVVEGAANYYVGEQGVLVHDNTPRLPAVGLVARR